MLVDELVSAEVVVLALCWPTLQVETSAPVTFTLRRAEETEDLLEELGLGPASADE
jgi:hypothetical protein